MGLKAVDKMWVASEKDAYNQRNSESARVVREVRDFRENQNFFFQTAKLFITTYCGLENGEKVVLKDGEKPYQVMPISIAILLSYSNNESWPQTGQAR